VAKINTLSLDAMRRISRAVAAHERGDRSMAVNKLPVVEEEFTIRLCKTTTEWVKGDLATVKVYEAGEPNAETISDPEVLLVDCVNKFATIKTDKWVMVARANQGRHYVISAEC